MNTVNETHDPRLKSWLTSANVNNCDFPIQNLPYVSFRRKGSAELPRLGVGIGDSILDLSVCQSAGLLTSDTGLAGEACKFPTLNPLMSLGFSYWSALRLRISHLLSSENMELKDQGELRKAAIMPISQAELFLAVEIGDYTDFYSSIHHALCVGAMFRPDSPLLENYKYVPVGYHGRASSVVPSDTLIRRPAGQIKERGENLPRYEVTKCLDFELEMGAYVGTANDLGQPIPIERAAEHIFGYSILNDWSARDIQRWEYQPLGPFLAKSFATSISPWIVSSEALAPYRTHVFEREEKDPKPLPYLFSKTDQTSGAIDIKLEAYIVSKNMREQSIEPFKLGESNFKDLYWTMAQLLTHHSSNGCNMMAGDLLGSGTISGNEKHSKGCLLEITMNGQNPLDLPGGEKRTFLEDGDEIIMKGFCEKHGYARIGMGECRGRIISAHS